MTAIYDIRMALLRNGYTPLPCSCETKRPVLVGWPDVEVTPELIDSWDIQFPKAPNTGLRLGALDLDILDQDVCDDLETEIRDWFESNGEVLVRFGNPPRRIIPIVLTDELTKTSGLFHDPSGKGQALELLGTRSQFLAYGTHPKGYAFVWANDRGPHIVPIANLPQVSAQEAIQLFEHLCEVLTQRHGYVGQQHQATNGHSQAANGDFDADTALATMQPAGASVEDTQRRVILSRLQHGVHPEDILDEVVDATMQVADNAQLGWTRDAEVEAVRNRIIKQFETAVRDCDKAPPGWLPVEFYQHAQEVLDAGHKLTLSTNSCGWYVRRQGKAAALKAAEQHGDRALSKDSGSEESKAAESSTDTKQASAAKKKTGITLRPFVPVDPATFPPRQWLYGRHYLRRVVSCTTAPGGFGKSTVNMVEAIAMATCRDLLGEQPTERVRVWYHNGEDNYEELNRRVLAICQHHGIDQSELVGWFFMTSGNEFPLRVATGYSTLNIDAKLVDQMKRQIAQNEIGLGSFDPLITLHGVPENDNVKMAQVVHIFGGIADEYNCAIELSHHTRKILTSDGHTGYEAQDTRGAGSIHDTVRALRIFNRMGLEEARAVHIPEHERASYFRVDRGKGNYSPAAKAQWRRFVNVELPNGDEVGVVTAWDYPGQGLSATEMAELERVAEHVFLQLLNRYMLNGQAVSDKPKGEYAPRRFAQEQEARLAQLTQPMLEGAMRRLFAANRIRVEKTNRHGSRLVPVR
jgi:RecA-family ATPase